jgi:hypothetical protein
VFAFDGDSPERLQDALAELHSDVPPTLWVDCVCILDRAVIHRHGVIPGPAGWTPEVAVSRGPLTCVEAGADSLLYFYLLLSQDLNAKALAPPDLLLYSRGIALPPPRLR